VLSRTDISGNTSDPRGGGSRPAGNEQEGWGVFRRTHVIRPLDVFGRPAWAKAVVAGVVTVPARPTTPVTVPRAPAAPALALPTRGTPAMLITHDGSVYSWNYGGGADSVYRHTNPARVADLEKHGMRHVRPGDAVYPLYANVVPAALGHKA